MNHIYKETNSKTEYAGNLFDVFHAFRKNETKSKLNCRKKKKNNTIGTITYKTNCIKLVYIYRFHINGIAKSHYTN